MPLLFDSDAAELDLRGDARSLHRLDREPDQAVVQQQDRARLDVARQLLVVEADAVVVAELAIGVEHERLPGLAA